MQPINSSSNPTSSENSSKDRVILLRKQLAAAEQNTAELNTTLERAKAKQRAAQAEFGDEKAHYDAEYKAKKSQSEAKTRYDKLETQFENKRIERKNHSSSVSMVTGDEAISNWADRSDNLKWQANDIKRDMDAAKKEFDEAGKTLNLLASQKTTFNAANNELKSAETQHTAAKAQEDLLRKELEHAEQELLTADSKSNNQQTVQPSQGVAEKSGVPLTPMKDTTRNEERAANTMKR